MPTFKHGKGANFQITDAVPTNRDVSNVVDEITFPQVTETAEVTAFGNNSKAYIVGLKDTTISGKGMFDPTTDGYFSGLLGLAAGTTWIFGPGGSAVGQVKYTGTAFLTKYEVGAPVGDKVAVQFEFQVSGDVTRTTF